MRPREAWDLSQITHPAGRAGIPDTPAVDFILGVTWKVSSTREMAQDLSLKKRTSWWQLQGLNPGLSSGGW